MNNEYKRVNRNDAGTHKKFKLRKRAYIPIVLIVLSISVILYIFLSYQSGLNAAKESGVNHEEMIFDSTDNNDGKKLFLLLGADREDDGITRTDVVMLGQYDYMQKDLKLVSIMRDVYVDIPGYQNYKINSVFSLGGVELLRQTLAENFGVQVEDYIVVDYQAFESVVDAINDDGITIDVEKDMSEKITTELFAGEQNLDGDELLEYARFRQDAEGDFGRVRRQQQVISAVKDEVLTAGGIFNLPNAAGTAMGHVNTSMSDAELYRMAASFLVRGDKDIESLTLPVEGSYQFMDTYHAGNVIDLDYELNSEVLHRFLNDELEAPEEHAPEENLEENEEISHE